ncbi:MAG: acylneuraminate cytidylyltransferase family protein [Methanoregula sp.]|jgi:CMP-N-acetylneuraminic acid synthetase|uniref:acylneuraminate cytidylyltransferase family protein n=1 Tax=Methanoregula sp. TaxID=2052170 RepID=UPI0025D45425|nr:acylneuraminate cytidylyltransferase family protein [Methanoregula sp.]MCK9631762.1 acylneuraminate cytidylyltransferase family protein [Methanoregula sp.]
MSLSGKTILAVIPARGGSKSIPHKNICIVGGLTLVGRAGRIASSLPWLDARILSTDDEEIANEGRRHGLDVPFMRPNEFASDTATTVSMWRHAWLAAETHYNMHFDVSVLLEPTSPLRCTEDVERTVRVVVDEGAPAAATVSLTAAHYTPHKTLTIDERGILGFYLPDGAKHSLRQGIPHYYHRNGLCYAVTRKHLVDKGWVIDRDAVAIVVNRPVVNVDEPFDLEMAEWLLSRENR